MLRFKIESIIFNVDFFDTTYRRNTSVFLVIMPIASRRLHPECLIQTVAAVEISCRCYLVRNGRLACLWSCLINVECRMLDRTGR